MHRETNAPSISIESFGYKHGAPADADFVFDVRGLPNPYWVQALRPLCGKDEQVRAFLDAEPLAQDIVRDIAEFVEREIRRNRNINRSKLTLAIGCTGGQHRSVYVAESVAERLSGSHGPIPTRHCELP
ncbi:RapZ C-terminal domain-containing protein [Candidatus Rariloculus sp.]|uniref:RapZ C-terminal domain-containing protein n=1 Tax=Candidatus Rariloculus sp. TaxID=3101265 RepID=UPI003D0E5805